MVNKKKFSKVAVATTAAATFGAAMTSMYLAPEMQADILDITWNGGNATATNPFFNGSGNPVSFDMDQVAIGAAGEDFVQWNDTFGGTGRTMSLGPSNTGVARHRLASSGEVLDPSTFTGTIANGLGGTEFDGSGTVFIGFQEAATNNVGWYQMSFTVGGAIFYGPGEVGSMGENVTVGGGGGGCNFALGDVNNDGVISLLDVSAFVTAVTGGPGAYVCEADFDQDGDVDLLDVAPFVAALTGG